MAEKQKSTRLKIHHDECFHFRFLFTDYSKIVQQRQLLDGQLNENKSVLEELNKLNDDKNTVINNYCKSLQNPSKFSCRFTKSWDQS